MTEDKNLNDQPELYFSGPEEDGLVPRAGDRVSHENGCTGTVVEVLPPYVTIRFDDTDTDSPGWHARRCRLLQRATQGTYPGGQVPEVGDNIATRAGDRGVVTIVEFDKVWATWEFLEGELCYLPLERVTFISRASSSDTNLGRGWVFITDSWCRLDGYDRPLAHAGEGKLHDEANRDAEIGPFVDALDEDEPRCTWCEKTHKEQEAARNYSPISYLSLDYAILNITILKVLISEMRLAARKENRLIRACFRGVPLCVLPGENPTSILERYQKHKGTPTQEVNNEAESARQEKALAKPEAPKMASPETGPYVNVLDTLVAARRAWLERDHFLQSRGPGHFETLWDPE